MQIAESELIINSRDAVYHLDARPEEIADTVILVGDPDRVPLISRHFNSVEFKLQHREFITHTGLLGNKRLTVISTGIGTDNIDIAMNELDALANIDLATRTIKTALTSLHIIRLGTSGSLQEDIPVDSLVCGTFGLGLDNVMHYYRQKNTDEENGILEAFRSHTSLTSGNVTPYIYSGSNELLKKFRNNNYYHGITVGCPGFYGPQGRILRLELAYPGLIDRLSTFTHNGHRISNFEMESSAIYGLGKAMGHECISVNAIVANRITKQFSKNSEKTVDKLIEQSLEVIISF